MDVSAEIESLSVRRQEIWCGGEGGPEVVSITRKLAELFEQRRHQRAKAATGPRRDEIVRQARVESELERLISAKSR